MTAAVRSGFDGTGTDADLTAAAVAGDGRAFDELYRRHAEAARRVAMATLRNPDDARDAVAEAFAKVFRTLAAARSFRPYLLAAVRNCALDIVRRSQRLELTDGAEEADNVQPVDRVVADEDERIVVQAFAQLPQRWQQALWLIDVEDLSTHDAGCAMGVSANNAVQLATRARSRLREEYLQLHVPNHIRPGCGVTVAALGAFVAGTAPPRRRAKVEAHLAACADCQGRVTELEDVACVLRRAVLPLPVALLSTRFGKRNRMLGGLRDRLQGLWSNGPPGRSVAGLLPDLTSASPILERVVAGVTATVLAVGVSTLAVGGRDGTHPADAASVSTPGPVGLPAAANGVVVGVAPGGAPVMAGGAGVSGSPAGVGGEPLGPGPAPLAGRDLSGADLPGAPLAGANLSGANLSGANLGGAVLGGANLTAANLTGANLAGAELSAANPVQPPLAGANLAGPRGPVTGLTGANLSGAVLGGSGLPAANLAGANLAGANLGNADLAGANLAGADLGNADLAGANLAGAHLGGAKLQGADLSRGNLRDADLTGALLNGSRLSGADLTGAKLASADLTGAVLNGARLTGADMTSARLVNTDLRDANLAGLDLRRADVSGALLPGAASSLAAVLGLGPGPGGGVPVLSPFASAPPAPLPGVLPALPMAAPSPVRHLSDGLLGSPGGSLPEPVLPAFSPTTTRPTTVGPVAASVLASSPAASPQALVPSLLPGAAPSATPLAASAPAPAASAPPPSLPVSPSLPAPVPAPPPVPSLPLVPGGALPALGLG